MKNPFFLSLLLLVSLVFTRCGNDIESVNSLTVSSKGPVMSASNITVIFSDSGQVKAKLFGKKVNRFQLPESFTEFPQGFKVEMYDSLMQIHTTITGDYGKRKEDLRIMEARGNVIVYNIKENKRLNTEQLTWDENRHTITSNVAVKITTNEMILFGDGLESNESFSKYNIKKTHGEMMVKKDSI